jgi:hypothetical protein
MREYPVLCTVRPPREIFLCERDDEVDESVTMCDTKSPTRSNFKYRNKGIPEQVEPCGSRPPKLPPAIFIFEGFSHSMKSVESRDAGQAIPRPHLVKIETVATESNDNVVRFVLVDKSSVCDATKRKRESTLEIKDIPEEVRPWFDQCGMPTIFDANHEDCAYV